MTGAALGDSERRGRVRYLAVASRRALSHKRVLRTYLRRAGL